MECSIVINGNNNIVKLGDNNSTINCEFWIEDNEGGIVLGDFNKILGRTHLAETEGQRIILGNNCLSLLMLFSGLVTVIVYLM